MASSLSSDSKHQRTDDLSPSASSGPQVSHDDDGQPTKRQCLDSEARARPDPEDSSSVAFVGLGAMGTHLARHLHGYSLSQLGRPALVWNRSPDKALQHATAHGTNHTARGPLHASPRMSSVGYAPSLKNEEHRQIT